MTTWRQKDGPSLSPETPEGVTGPTNEPGMKAPPRYRRVSKQSYVNDRGQELFEVIGDSVSVSRMNHDRRQTCYLTAALIDHLAGPGGPLHHLAIHVAEMEAAIDEFLAYPF